MKRHVGSTLGSADSGYAPVFSASTALGRYARPEEVGVGVAFLARASSTYVTGMVMDVDGGYSA